MLCQSGNPFQNIQISPQNRKYRKSSSVFFAKSLFVTIRHSCSKCIKQNMPYLNILRGWLLLWYYPARVQKRTLRIMNPGVFYEESVSRTCLEKLSKRRPDICKMFAMSNKLSGPLSYLFKNESNSIDHKYDLRNTSELNFTDRIRTDNYLNFITCKYQNCNLLNSMLTPSCREFILLNLNLSAQS